MASTGRSLGDSQVAKKRIKLAGEWLPLADDEERVGVTDLAAILQYLMLHPEETKKAKAAILGEMLNKGCTKNMDENFNNTYIYLSRVPMNYSIKVTLPQPGL